MTPDELLRLYPRETLRWLRGRLGLSQLAFALDYELSPKALSDWERRHRAPSDTHRARLAALLAPYLATPEGEAFARSLGRGKAIEAVGEEGETMPDTSPMGTPERTQRARPHIFVINRSPDVLNLMRDLLQDERYNVTTTNFIPATFDSAPPVVVGGPSVAWPDGPPFHAPVTAPQLSRGA